jgi:hypothetical protein
MNSLEMQLRSWELRRPSATLERRLFHARSRRRPGVVLAFRWLAPAAACAFLALTVLNQQSGISAGPSHHDPMVAMIRSNLSTVASASNDLTRAGSDFPGAGFEWTNRSDSTSSVGSFLPTR